MLTILLLGPPQILRDGVAVVLPRRRSRALVYYLAAQSAPVSREQLIALLWPEHERSAAQQLLRTTLHGVRRALGAGIVGDETLAVAADSDVDYRALAAVVAAPAADEAALAAAVARYRDDLLGGFSLPDAEPFEAWLAAERERAHLLVVRGFTRLARAAEQRGDYPSALAALDRALAFDPLQEDLQRSAIRLHYLAGDRVGAIRRYEHLCDLLDAELGVPPMSETRALYDAVVTDTLLVDHPPMTGGPPLLLQPPAASQEAVVLPFTGRERELATMAVVGPGRLALVEGEAGIGKTRLAREVLARHIARGGLALSGAARELEQSLPYQPWVGLLRDLLARPEWPVLRARLDLAPLWLSEVARLLPELAVGEAMGPPVPPPDEARLWEGVTRLLIALAGQTPLLLLLDDLHWADASSLGLLGYLLRRVGDAPLCVVATARPVERRAPLSVLLSALTREERIERVSLQRLSAAETERLARALSPHDAARLAAWLQHSAEGNPYIIDELVRHARASGLLDATGHLSPALPAAPVVPTTVYSLIEARLVRLSDEARRVLDAAVAAGRVFAFEVVARAAGVSEAAALDALDELRATRLVEPLPDGRFQFDHSLTMEVAYREVGEPRHRALHRRLAETLETLHRDRLDEEAGLIAWHFAEGGAPERAAAYALRAGRRAASVAARAEAINFYEQALAGASPARRPAVLTALGEVLLLGGEAARAAERFREILALTREPGEARRTRLNLARALVPQGRYAEVIDLVRGLEQAGPLEERSAALFLWGTALSLEGADLAEAALRLHEAERLVLAQPAPDPAALAQVRFELGSVAAQQGDLPRAIAHYREALAVAEEAAADPNTLEGALTWRILARNNLAYHLHLLGDDDAASRYAAEGLRLAEERGALGLQPYLRSTSGEIATARGELASAEAHFSTGLALAERLGVPERVAGISANLGLLALRRGQTALAIHHLSAALARADALGTRHLAAQIRLWLAPLLPPAEARIALAEARAIAESGGRRRLLAEIARLEQAL